MYSLKVVKVLALIFLAAQIIFGASNITLHVYDPWIDNTARLDSLFILGNSEVGYYPGTSMEKDGGGWFTYTFKTSQWNPNDGFQFASHTGTHDYESRVTFPDSTNINFQYLSTNFPNSTEFWIIPKDSIKNYNIYNIPPKSKVIHLFNPWPDNSPQIFVAGFTEERRMQVNTDICGWYTYYFNGFIDSLKKVYFTDYFKSSKYLSGGLIGGNPIDLSTILSTNDTVYIVPKPFPSGPPSISTTFPGKIGECPSRKISALVRDWKADGVSFFEAGSISGGVVIKGMVQNQLGANGKPVPAANATQGHGSALGSWFITKDSSTQTCVDLTFTKGYDGRWEFDSDPLGGFFPIDSFNDPNNIKYPGPSNKLHNFHFTMEMHMLFTYHKGAKQTFYFRGDDDVWIFVNNNLAIDLGSLHEPASDSLILDKDATKLGLTDGINYNMDIFYCERQPPGSNLLIKTSLDLHNSDQLFYKDSLISTGKIQYNIRQLHKVEGLDKCGSVTVNGQEEAALVSFSIRGPQFHDTAFSLPPAKTPYFGGIVVDTSNSSVIIDSASIKDLLPGEYSITFTSKLDPDRSGFLKFMVAGKIPAILFANPPDGSHFKTNTYIKLSTNPDARIYFTTDGTAPDTTKQTQLYTDSIMISKSLTLKAIAIGNNYLPTSGSFTYTRDLDSIKLTADPPSGTHFRKDTTITLTASNGARVYYTIDGSNPDTNNISQLYSAPFTITATKNNPSITVKAIAVGNYLVTISKSWTYTRDMPAATLTATPGDGYHFGDSLSITLSSNADTIYYTLDGSDPVVGSSQTHLYTVPFTITKDTVIVKAIAVGKEFANTSKQWKYISDRVPDIQAHPGSCAFLDKLSVILTVNDLTAKIYYTVDGSEPTQNSTSYNGPILITMTTQLKARAFANNKVPSAIFTANYTKKSSPIEAFYYDNNADGNIDSISIKLDLKASGIPDSILLAAYGGLIKTTIKANRLKLSDDGLSVFAVIEPPFSSVNTKSNDAGSGVLEGLLFNDSGFNINDKVAPVLKSAQFAPDVLDENMSRLGSLNIKFSEPVESIKSEYPFNFYQTGTQYKLKLRLISVSSYEATFDVLGVEGINFPKNGDSVNIAPSQGVKDAFENEQNNPSNFKIPLKVLPQPYAINFQIGPNPFEPGISKISTEVSGITITSGVAIVADFRANLKGNAENIKAEISVYDPVAHIICDANDSRSINGILEIKIVTIDRTKVFIVWSGRNKSGRRVGTGSYLAVVKITDPSGIIVTKEFMIGVRN